MVQDRNTIVFVCTGNTCRSPMAERLLAHALEAEPHPLSSLKVLSAGTAAYAGDPPSPNSVEALRRVNIDLTDHRSRALSDHLLADALVVFGMTESHKFAIERFTADLQNAPPVLLMRELIPAISTADLEIPDPFGGPLSSYEAARDSMVEAIPAIVGYLRQRLATQS